MIIYGEFRPDNIVLGANSKVCANLAHLIANAEPSHECLSARYRDQTSQHGNCCGLTSTVVTQESSNLSIVHSKVKSVHSSELLFSKSAREFLPEIANNDGSLVLQINGNSFHVIGNLNVREKSFMGLVFKSKGVGPVLLGHKEPRRSGNTELAREYIVNIL